MKGEKGPINHKMVKIDEKTRKLITKTEEPPSPPSSLPTSPRLISFSLSTVRTLSSSIFYNSNSNLGSKN